IRRFRDSKKNTAEEDEEVQEAINRARAQRDPARGDDFNQLDEPADVSMDSDEDDAPMPPVRGRGRGSRARGGRGQSSGSRGRARGAGSQASRGGRSQKAALTSPVKTKSIMD
ncbi:double-strand break repair protein MRE11 isoform X1, partial [Tachysurus ichikawai]